MKNVQPVADRTAIGLSLLCVVHCLFLPLAVVLLPSVAALSLQDEAFHYWMVIAVVPISVCALIMGCKKHKHYRVLAIGSTGVLVLAMTAFFGHELLGEGGEKALTVFASGIIALAHVWNYRLCQHDANHECLQ